MADTAADAAITAEVIVPKGAVSPGEALLHL